MAKVVKEILHMVLEASLRDVFAARRSKFRGLTNAIVRTWPSGLWPLPAEYYGSRKRVLTP
jgi:hypothetical protein